MPILYRRSRSMMVRRKSAAQTGRQAAPLRSPSQLYHLIGSLCRICGTYSMPRRAVCPHCRGEDMEEVRLSGKGRLETFAIIRQGPPGYDGPMPYVVGTVTLPEGVRLRALINGCQPEDLTTGMEVEMDPVTVGQNRAVDSPLTQAFRPV